MGLFLLPERTTPDEQQPAQPGRLAAQILELTTPARAAADADADAATSTA